MTTDKQPAAIVTGGGSGIGEAVCHELARRGLAVIVADIDEGRAKWIAKDIRLAGGQAQPVRVDVSDARQVQRLVDDAADQQGRLDFMVNNAGVAIVAGMLDMTPEWWRKTVDVNFWGVLHGTDAAYRVMARQGGGHIVNVASGGGLVPAPYCAAYTATKHAVVGLSTALRAEAAIHGVRVSVVCPGTVRTPIFDDVPSLNFDQGLIHGRLTSQKMMTPAEAARAIMRGVDRDQAIIVFPAMMRLIWWLYRLSPGGVERTLLKKFTADFHKMQVAG